MSRTAPGLARSISVGFDLIDRDGDGSLSRKELMRALATDDQVRRCVQELPGLAERLHPSRIRASIESMDSDGDSVITPEEFQSFVAQVAEDYKFDALRARAAAARQRQESDVDALPDIAKVMVIRKWLRYKGRSQRIAAEHARRKWLTRGLEAFCQAGWNVDCSTLELARLHREEYDAKAVVLDVEKMLSWPSGIESFREAEAVEQTREQWRVLRGALKSWRQYVAAARANLGGIQSIAYWARYKRARSYALAQEVRARAVLSDSGRQDPHPGALAPLKGTAMRKARIACRTACSGFSTTHH